MRISKLFLLSGLLALTAALAPAAVAQQEAPWEAFMQVEWDQVETDDGIQWVPQFNQDIQDLEQKSVLVTGYMIPLSFEENQTHFLISAWPGDGCFFHMPGGPSAIVEVKAPRGVAYTYDTIAIEGTLELLRDDPYGLLYRMVDAKPAR